MNALVMLSVLCQTLLYCPTVNKYWQTNGHHQSSCKGKAFSCCCIILIKMFLLSPKNSSAFDGLLSPKLPIILLQKDI